MRESCVVQQRNSFRYEGKITEPSRDKEVFGIFYDIEILYMRLGPHIGSS